MLSLNLLLAGGGVVAALAVAAYLYHRGVRAERDKALRDRMQARDTADSIADAVAGREPSVNRERLKQW